MPPSTLRYYPIGAGIESYGVSNFQAPYVTSSGVPAQFSPGWFSPILFTYDDLIQAEDQYGNCNSIYNPSGPVLSLAGTDGYPITDNEESVYEYLYLMQTFASMYCSDAGFQFPAPDLRNGYNAVTFIGLSVSGQIL